MKLGLAAGHYRVIAKRPGYYPAEAAVDATAVGVEKSVQLELRPILGRVLIEGESAGARVRVDDDKGVPRCVLPCSLELPPGAHVLHLTLEAHRSSDLLVNVVAQSQITVRPVLEEVTGTVVVTTDEPGALIVVDGDSRGFTLRSSRQAAGRSPSGSWISPLPGFRANERTVDVTPDRQQRLYVPMIQAEEVQAAARAISGAGRRCAELGDHHSPRGAPRVRLFDDRGRRARRVRGLYVWNDRTYTSIGVRGLGRLGSYTNRELVLADGHPTNDDWVGSAYVGFDGRTDLADVERIEVVRGPGSVLYGTNAFSGVINVVNRGVGEKSGGEAGVSAAGAGVGRARVRGQLSFGKDGGIWLSVAGAHGEGRDFYFPELRTGTAPGEDGFARSVDGFAAGTVQGRVVWKWLTAQWFLNSHEKHLPTGEFDTVLGDPRTQQTDTRGFVELRAEPVLSRTVQLLSRVHADLYGFQRRPRAFAGSTAVSRKTPTTGAGSAPSSASVFTLEAIARG